MTLQQYMNHDLLDVQAGFRQGRGTRDEIANICWIIKKAKEFQKIIYFCFIDYAKTFDYVDHNKLWDNRLVPNWERSMSISTYCHPAYLTYTQSTSWGMPGWMKHKIAWRNINNLRDADDTTLWQKVKGNLNESLDEVERGEWKSWLKIQHSEN